MKYFTLIISLFITSQSFGQWDKFYEVNNDNFYTLCLNEERLFIGAEFANIYRQSIDTSFDKISLQGYGFLADIEFVNNKIGFASGGCYYTTAECPANVIYKTMDGGLSWELITQFGQTGLVTDIEIINENKIFVTTEYEGLHLSEDGGMTWTLMTIDSEILHYHNLQFIDENIGFARGQKYTQNQERYGIIFKTIDGGQTWNEIYDATSFSTDFWDYYFINKNKGFITSNNGEIRQTTDGGLTWTNITVSTNTAEQNRQITFVNNQVGYLNSYDKVSKKSRLYRTTNGGQNWQLELTIDEHIMSDFTFQDEANGYLISNYRTVYKRTGTIESIENSLDLIISPNPTNDYFSIANTTLPIGNYQLSVFDTSGKLILSTQNIYENIEIQSWVSGIYFIEIRNEQSELISRGKLVKQP